MYALLQYVSFCCLISNVLSHDDLETFVWSQCTFWNKKMLSFKVCCLFYNWPLSLIIFSVNHILGNFASPRLQSHTQKKNRTNLPTMMRKPSLVLYWLVWFGRTTWSSRAPAALASTVRMLSSVCRKRWRHLHRKQIKVKNCIRKIP